MRNRLWCAEEHGEVLVKWWQLGLSRATVVCLDRHLDFKRISPERLQRLAQAANDEAALADGLKWCPYTDSTTHLFGSDDFLYAAASLGMVEHLLWVFPAFEPCGRRALGRVLWETLRLLPGHGHEIIASIGYKDGLLGALIGGTRVSICTLADLPQVTIQSGWHLDIDLDYFWDDERRRIQDVVADLAVAVRSLPSHRPDLTAAYSISSGYLPEDGRFLGRRLATVLSCDYRSLPTRPFPACEEWSALIGRQATCLRTDEYCDPRKVSVPSGTRHALRSLLALSRGDVGEAERLHGLAQEQGDRATWPAYKIGLHFLSQKDYARAARWFRNTSIEIVDTIQAHALCLLALCHLRSGEYEEAFALARRCIGLLPMCEEGYVIASSALPHIQNARSYAEDLEDQVASLTAVRARLDL